MAGKENLDSMVNGVQKQQSVSGFNQFGNAITGAQDINVSNGEYKVSKKDAQKIGYDTLNNINDAGKPFVEQLDSRGYAEGDQVAVFSVGARGDTGSAPRDAVEEYFETIVRPEEFNTEYYKSKEHFNKKGNEYVGYLDSVQEKEKQDAEEKGKVYTPTFTTFGPGFTVTGDHVGDRKSKWEIDKEAIKRWKQAVKSAKKILGSDTHNAVLPIAEMVYQMGEGKDPVGKKGRAATPIPGTGVRGFKNMLAAIAVGDSEKAYKEALDSKWYKQTPKRAKKVAERLKKSLRVAPDHLSNRGFVSVPLEPPATAPAFSPGVASRFSETGRDAPKGFVNLPEDYSEQQYREGLEEGDIIRGTLGVPESSYMSPDENRLGRLPV
jgi:hypothetical protein